MNKRYLSICFVLSFFYQSLVVCNSKNFTSLVRFIPKYFIVFDAIVARILFSDIQLIVECTAVIYIQVSFYMLILHPETLLKLLTSSSSVLGLWDFLYVRSYHLQKKKKKKAILFLLPFLFGSLLFLFLSQFLWLRFPVLCWIGMWEWVSLSYFWS